MAPKVKKLRKLNEITSATKERDRQGFKDACWGLYDEDPVYRCKHDATVHKSCRACKVWVIGKYNKDNLDEILNTGCGSVG